MGLNTGRLRSTDVKRFADEHLNLVARLCKLGAPVLADVDRIVTSANMKVGAYTIAAQPDVPRNITVTQTAGDTEDTNGTIVVVGTDYAGETISETITPNAGATVAGVKAFKTVTSVTGVGWVIDGSEGTNDTITVGVGTAIGLPFLITSNDQVVMGVLGTTITAVTVAHDDRVLSKCTADMSAGTYNGTKVALVFVVE